MNTSLLAVVSYDHTIEQLAPWLLIFLPIIIAVAIWDVVWKLIALWKSARNDQMAWFICLAVFNTAGILPILYILFFQRTGATQVQRV